MTTRSKDSILLQAKLAREERQNEVLRTAAAVKIQSWLRSIHQREKFLQSIRKNLESSLHEVAKSPVFPASRIFKEIQLFLRICNFSNKDDIDRFEAVVKYITKTVLLTDLKCNYAGLALDKTCSQQWVTQVKNIGCIAVKLIKDLDPSAFEDGKRLILFLHLLISLTSCKTWGFLKNAKPLELILEQVCINILQHLAENDLYTSVKYLLYKGVCNTKMTLKPASMTALLTLGLRPLLSKQNNELISLFILNILSVPSLLYQLNIHSPEIVQMMCSQGVFVSVVKFLDSEQNSKIVFNSLEGSLALCLLANLVDLAAALDKESLKSIVYPCFVSVATKLLDSCQLYVAAKKSHLTQWHPLLGWFAQNNCDHSMVLPHVGKQLQKLWSRNLVLPIFGCLNNFVGLEDLTSVRDQGQEDKPGNAFTNFFRKTLKIDDSLIRKALDKSGSKQVFKLGSPEVTQVALNSILYGSCLTTLSQLRVDILTSLAFCDDFLVKFWNFLKLLGPQCGLKSFLELLTVNSKATSPEFLMLQLFAELMTHFLTVIDDVELFEQQKAFPLPDLLLLAQFLNSLLVRAVWNGYVDVKSLSTPGPMQSLHALLLTLHKRDSRRSFTSEGFWLTTDPKPSYVLLELERKKRSALTLLQKMPHVIPHPDRVVLFRSYVFKEKTALGLTESTSVTPQSTLVAIRRSRLVEDGFRQLSLLHPHSTKGVIRVKFINDLGLDEAGIDQDGVFKEFLEETLKRIFDPSLNIFKTTSEQKLYPSPTSYLTETHLELFEFVGRMLGKAVYEGITVDVQFAPFFLHQLLGHTNSGAYSALDDLASLDPDLYRNLTYLKHYDGDIADLQLTFSVDEEIMGKLATFDIVPGGRATPVTDSNKISYVHQMAHFKLHTQIKDQTQAFLRGFRTLVNQEWLALFSGPELQRLISGDNVSLDVRDLRRHTQYYGGFHDSHRVVQWLWEIVEKEFTDKEQKQFLKFITSCSSPPLLGFAHLEPPFSIRCVEVGDDEDRGDTIGSVIRGFLTLHRKDPVNRLPTASTCFNLLKLPNYQRKSTLREKLKYSIQSNSGFELS